ILCSCNAVISGSTALHILLLEQGTPWATDDLDIDVPQCTIMMLLNWLKFEGYFVISNNPHGQQHYTYSLVECVLVASNGECKINIVISGISTALSPIFQFHSTTVMNFISADTIFCCYPTLMLCHQMLVNVGLLYHGMPNRGIIDPMCKYSSCGFYY
ncbi:hypothetical protein EDC04DRAFT_2515472, partial [Pisolithus marmoratus]